MVTKGETTKLAILEAGLAMASRLGLEKVTIGELAKVTGMSKSGLFAHFQSKENLQIAIVDFAARGSLVGEVGGEGKGDGPMAEHKRRGRGWAIASLILGCIGSVVGGLLASSWLRGGPSFDAIGAFFAFVFLVMALLVVTVVGLVLGVVALRRNRTHLVSAALVLNGVGLLGLLLYVAPLFWPWR